MATTEAIRERLGAGLVIPACPLALNAQRRFDERRQRALIRYYLAAGVGGLAVGVHTTQFAIRKPEFGLLRPVLELAAEEVAAHEPLDRNVGSIRQPLARAGQLPDESGGPSSHQFTVPEGADQRMEASPEAPEGHGGFGLRIAGLCGPTPQAVAEATLARELGYHAGLLSLGALPQASEDQLLRHGRAVADVLPLFGFYLQPAAGGRLLGYSFWRRFAEIPNVVAIKIAPFNRYQTLDVIRALAEAGRDDVALYTGNDDNIVLDLLTPYRFRVGDRTVERRIVGGLLGHWAVWTRRAVELHRDCRRVVAGGGAIPPDLLRRAVEVTDCNAAFFDAGHDYAGCIPGIHEILCRQGLLEGTGCLDPNETLSPGQREEIDRVCRAYPHLSDDAFVAEHRDPWLAG